jgi:hypothetical protein
MDRAVSRNSTAHLVLRPCSVQEKQSHGITHRLAYVNKHIPELIVLTSGKTALSTDNGCVYLFVELTGS